MRAHLDRARIPYGAKAVAETQRKLDGVSRYPADILGLTVPGVSPDGAQALVMTSLQSGPQSGLGQFFLLKRQPDGSWVRVSLQHFWVS
jgi:hypothetical protein